MARDKNFVEREAFEQVLARVATANGNPYQDVATIYGDMSRLVVGLLASACPEELREVYARGGWGGSPNVRALHEAAKEWYSTHHPARLPSSSESGAA